MITLIVARARNGAIGKDNAIPWEAPEDLAFFQRETLGGALIMGRMTWDSLPFKPLPRRLNIVVSSRGVEAETVLPSVEAAVEHAYASGYRRVYGIGGTAIFAELMPRADRLVVTEVDLDIADPQAVFPSFDPAEWERVGGQLLRDAGPRCEASEYLRRRSV
jgi:dihydrofolate reductase